MPLQSNFIKEILKNAFAILPNSFKKRSSFLFIGIVINSFLDLIGLAAILPLLMVILKKDFVEGNEYISTVYEFLGFTDQRYFVLFLCVFILFFIISKNLFGLWIQKTQIKFSWDIHASISSRVLKSAYNKGYSFFTSQNSNHLLNHIVDVPRRFSETLMSYLFQFFNEIVVLTLIIISLLIFDFKILLLLTIIVVPVFLVFYKLSKNKITYYNEVLNDLGAKMRKPIFEVVFGFVDVSITGVFDFFKKKYEADVVKSKEIRVKYGVLQQVPNKLIEFCVIFTVLIMLLYGVFVLKDIEKIIGMLGVFGLAAYRAIPSINRLMLSVVNLRGEMFVFDKLNKYLPFKDTSIEQKSIQFERDIELTDLSFRYQDSAEHILKDYNLKIKKGESVGLIGKSGSGKTTLMNLMLGFLHQEQGAIKIDGVELTKSTMDAWQKKIGYVRQDVFLVDGTIRDNIAFGVNKDDVNEVKLHEVLFKSQLAGVINSLPKGIETNVGERGIKLSGGQRQRLGIARALYNDSELLFFDEATSALDSETETEITDAIRSLQDGGLTMIIIAHRESTLKYCDRIIDFSTL